MLLGQRGRMNCHAGLAVKDVACGHIPVCITTQGGTCPATWEIFSCACLITSLINYIDFNTFKNVGTYISGVYIHHHATTVVCM